MALSSNKSKADSNDQNPCPPKMGKAGAVLVSPGRKNIADIKVISENSIADRVKKSNVCRIIGLAAMQFGRPVF